MQITIARPGQNLGPFTLDQINAQLASGHLQPHDLAWQEGQSNWVPLHTLPGVRVPAGSVAGSSDPARATAPAKKTSTGKMVAYGLLGLVGLCNQWCGFAYES